ncbi:hypothetical protein Syun_018756 [Stephania yunnanensis]|uniref:Kinesin motor domain-containing protein n=1 Tax=Stephania yunnanensis TaxID=152371 RepID=A0AAP0ISV0_9MAGN
MILDLIQELSERSDGCGYVFIGANSESSLECDDEESGRIDREQHFHAIANEFGKSIKARFSVGILLMNMESSRSHCAHIFTVQQELVRDTRLKTRKLILLDLAASAKIEKTGAEGKILEEAKFINKSLSAPDESLKHLTVDASSISFIQNEYGNVNSAYGAAVNPYIKWPASMATSLSSGVPWVMCQQSDAPDPVGTLQITFFLQPVYVLNRSMVA